MESTTHEGILDCESENPGDDAVVTEKQVGEMAKPVDEEEQKHEGEDLSKPEPMITDTETTLEEMDNPSTSIGISKVIAADYSEIVVSQPEKEQPSDVSFNLATTDAEISNTEVETVKDNFVSEFHKFLQQETAGCGIESSSSQDVPEKSISGGEAAKPPSFIPNISDDTSNSSWYKIDHSDKDKAEEVKTSSASLLPDEASNLSMADNGSCVSSNIGDTMMSFQEEDCSNLSMPEDSVSAYSGHQPVFDESANMNPPSNLTFARPDTPSSENNKTTTSESTPVKRFRRGTLQIAAEDASEHGHGVTANDICEYQWPQETDAEFFMLQEQISMYLDVKSFKRKYPDLFRRVCDKHEKDYLRDKGVVSETQCDLGLTAVKADEVHDLMGKDYPAKYKEFIKVLHEREKQKLADRMKKEFHSIKMEKDKMMEYTKKAMKSVSEWNRNMLKEKNEERKAYFDMQTFTIQYPKSKYRKLEMSPREIGAYPLAIIPGQFQDSYKNYTMDELKYFPLNTSIVDPPKKYDGAHALMNKQAGVSDSDDSSSSSGDDAPAPARPDDSEEEKPAEKTAEKPAEKLANDRDRLVRDRLVRKLSKDKPSSREISMEKSSIIVTEPVIKLDRLENNCRMCKDDPPEKQRHDETIVCTECKSQAHTGCLDMDEDMVKIIKTYPWQCMECKTCVQCMDPYDEDKMLFCDKCDRGYHTFCVGLKSLPSGQWDCFSCRGDTTPIKPLPRPTPKKRGRKPREQQKDKPEKEKDVNTPRRPPGRPPGRPPKDRSKYDAKYGVGVTPDTPGVTPDTPDKQDSNEAPDTQQDMKVETAPESEAVKTE